MGREIFQVRAKDTVLKLNQFAAINAVQSFDWDPTFNEQYSEQLGDENNFAFSAQPEVSGSFELQSTGATVAFLKRMINSFDGTGEFQGSVADVDGDNNAGTVRAKDLEYSVFDIMECKKPNDTFDRTLLLPRAFLTSLSFRADANGNAMETMNFEGDLAEVYQGTFRDLTTIPVTRDSGSSTTAAGPVGFSFDTDGGDVAADYTIEYLMVDNVRIDAADLTVASVDPDSTPDSGDEYNTITVGPGAGELTLGSRLSLVIYKKAPGSVPTIENPTTARFVRGDDIDIWLVPRFTDGSGNPVTEAAFQADPVTNSDDNLAALADGTLNTMTFGDPSRFLRVQSVDMNIDLRREALREIKKNPRNTTVYYRAATFPLAASASATVLETDLADWGKLINKTGDDDVLNLGDFEKYQWQIVCRYYVGDTVLQTVAATDMRVNGRGARISVGGRAEVSWSFIGSELVVEGADV